MKKIIVLFLLLSACDTYVYAPIIHKAIELCRSHGDLDYIQTEGPSREVITAHCADGMQMEWAVYGGLNKSPIVERVP